MLRWSVLFCCAVLVLGAGATAAEPTPRLLVVVTSGNAEVQGMAFVLSRASRQQGADIRLLLCGPGGDAALKESPQTVLKPRGATPRGLLAQLVAMGVKAEVCALYLPNKGKSAADLIDGVGVAKPPAIAREMLAPNTRLFTF